MWNDIDQLSADILSVWYTQCLSLNDRKIEKINMRDKENIILRRMSSPFKNTNTCSGVKKQNIFTIIFSKVWEVFRVFSDLSSIHALKYLASRNKHPLEYCVWAVTTVLCLYGVVSLSDNAWRRYQNNPTVVSVDMSYNAWKTTFPAILICPYEKFDEHRLTETLNSFDYVKDKEGLKRFLMTLSNVTYGSLSEVYPFEELNIQDYWKAVDRMRFSYTYVVSNSDIDHYNVTTLTRFISELGVCYSYNSVAAFYNAPEYWEENKWEKLGQFPVFAGNPMDGDIFVQIRRMNTGYDTFLINPAEFPDVSLPRLSSSVHSLTTVDLKALSIVSTPETEQLSLEQRKCRLTHESNLRISPVYSYNLCRMECRMQACHDLCGCVPYFYRPLKEFKVCAHEGMLCLDQHTELLTKLIDPVTERKLPCNCWPLCHEVNYYVDMEHSIFWAKTTLKVGINKYPRFRLKREVLFGFTDVLVAVGGAAGFFLGCSLITFVEVMYFFSFRKFEKTQHERQGEYHFEKNVITIHKHKYLQWCKKAKYIFAIIFSKVWEVFRVFSDLSSIHALKYLASRNKHPLEYCVWAVTTVLCLYGVVSLSDNAWRRYQNNPTVVSVDMSYNAWKTSFPAILIFPYEKFDEHRLTETLNSFDYVKDKEGLKRFLMTLSNGSLSEVYPFEELNIQDYWKAVDRMRFSYTYVVSNSDIDHYNVTTLTRFISELGVCYSYNSVAAFYNAPDYWEENKWEKLGPFPVFAGNPMDGDIFVQIRRMFTGYDAFLISPAEFPDVSLPRVSSPDQYLKSVDLKALSIVSTPETEQLSLEQRKCRLTHESNLRISPVYSYNLCRMECRMQACHDLCGCVPYFYRPLKEFKVCDHEGMQCLDQHTELLTKLIDPVTESKLPCNCWPLCHEVNYYVDMENSIFWGMANLRVGINKYPRFRLKREVLFGFTDVLVAVGGAAGFFLGSSLITFVEVMYFFSFRFVFYCLGLNKTF